MVVFLCLILSVFSQDTELSDGKTVIVDSTALFGVDKHYKFLVTNVTDSDLTISLTTYSDYSDPDMFVSPNKRPDYNDYTYSSLSWGSGSIIIPPSELTPNTSYFILVACYSFCKFGLTVSYTKEISLSDGLPISGNLKAGQQAIYIYVPGEKNDRVTINLSKFTGKVDMYVAMGDSEPSSDNSLDVEDTWDGAREFTWAGKPGNATFKVAVMAEEELTYVLLATSGVTEAVSLQASVPISGEVATGKYQYYKINVLSPNETLSISLTMMTGDGDIFVSCGELPSIENFNFSSVHMGNENLVISESDRKRVGCPTGVFYIGIYGYLHAAYTLLVSTSNSSIIALQPGIPQSGSVIKNEFEYYSLAFPKEDTNITIYLTVGSGNPDLYVKFCKGTLSKCFFTEDDLKKLKNIYSSLHMTGSESVEIAHNVSNCPRKASCNYLVGVLGVDHYSTFTLQALTNNSNELVLREGRPSSISQQKDEIRYFKFKVFNTNVTDVQFIITPVYGDPDLYSNFNEPCDYEHFDRSSLNAGIEVDQVTYTKGKGLDTLEGTFHLLVYSMNATSYSIVAKETVPQKNTTIQIYPGHPQKDTIFNLTDKDYRIYSFPIHFTEETKQAILITLTPITGSFVLYAANQISNLDWKNEIFYYNWMSNITNASNPSNIITISPSDHYYLLDSTYLILVMGKTYLKDKSATYSISFVIGNSTMILSEDIPITEVVDKDDYNFYRFPVHVTHEDITISVNGLSGDPDVFISVSPENTTPTQVSHDFKSTTFGSEIITLIWEDGLKQKCPSLPETYKFGDQTHCQLYIGVYGFEVSTYTIRVHVSKNLPLLLSLGESVFGNLTRTMYNFYYVFANAQSDLSVVLQPTLGDSDLFINILDKGDNSSPSDWKRPSREHNDLSSQSTVMSEEIKLVNTTMNTKCPSGTCVILISSYCFSDNCTYLLIVKQSEAQMLRENTPTYGFVNQSTEYYSYYCDQDFTDFLITLTSLNDGNPDLFVSRGKDSKPSEENNEWSSQSWGADSILITRNDPVINGKSMKGTYIIAVKSEWSAASFTLMINNHPSPVIKLLSGVPQSGNITSNSIAYYTFDNFINGDIVVSLTPTWGSGKIYINTVYFWDDNVYSNLPGPDSFRWSSGSNAERYSFMISTDDDYFCSYCKYVIGVKTENEPITFMLTVKNDISFIVLQNGVPMKAEAKVGKMVVFSFEVLQVVDFYVTVTPYSGHPTLYVTQNKTLNSDSYLWAEYYIEDVLNLKINTSDVNFKTGTYYLLVTGFESLTFSIVAHTKTSSIVLVDGWPIFYALTLESADQVDMRFTANEGSKVYCTVTASPEFLPVVHTKFQNPNLPFSPATAENSEKSYNSSYYQSEYSQLSITLSHNPGKNQLNLGIYSSKTANFTVGKFQIFCSSSAQTTVMRVGTMQIEILNKDLQQKRYELVTSKKGTIDIYVIPCLGDFKLEISSNWNVITQENPDIIISRMTDGVLSATVPNANGRYFVSVSILNAILDEMQVYEIISQFTDSGKVINKRYNPGNNGLLTWNAGEKPNSILVSWAAVMNETMAVEDANAEYRVYFTEEKSSHMVTACGIHYFRHRKQVIRLGKTTQLRLEVELPSEKGFINVVAVLPKDSKSPIKEIVYDPTEVMVSAKPEKSRLVLFWILAALLAVAVVTAIYFYKKKKRAEVILNYEMNDVRNVASVSSPNPEKGGKRVDPYAPLSN